MVRGMDVLKVSDIGKEFTLHAQGGQRIPVVAGVSFDLAAGEALALAGPSGVGKSTVLRMLYGNYACGTGQILVRDGDGWLNLAGAEPRNVLRIRRNTIGYISQFLRVIPRVPCLDVVAEPLRLRGLEREEAHDRAGQLLKRLAIPETLWGLSPVTFSGGEQQRVNVARGFAAAYSILLLDEPTASLDAQNRETVMEMIVEARQAGTALVGIFHDAQVRAAVTTRSFDLTLYKAAS